MRMRREAGHDGLARIGQVGREAGHFVALHPGVDEQRAGPEVQRAARRITTSNTEEGFATAVDRFILPPG